MTPRSAPSSTACSASTVVATTSGFGGLVREPGSPRPRKRPYGGYFDTVVDALEAAYPNLGDALLRVVIDRGEADLVHCRRAHSLGGADDA